MYLQVASSRRLCTSFNSPETRVLAITDPGSGMTPHVLTTPATKTCRGGPGASRSHLPRLTAIGGLRHPPVSCRLLCLYRFVPALVYACSGVAGLCPEFVLNLQEAVVFRDALAAAGRACLDLPHAGGHGQVGDAGVIGLTGTVRDDSAVSILAGNLNAFERFRQSADLVELDQNGIGDSVFDALAENRRVW